MDDKLIVSPTEMILYRKDRQVVFPFVLIKKNPDKGENTKWQKNTRNNLHSLHSVVSQSSQNISPVRVIWELLSLWSGQVRMMMVEALMIIENQNDDDDDGTEWTNLY